jgi:hypothetical protein
MAYRVPMAIVGLGLFCAGMGGYETLSHASLRLTGEKTTAILVDRNAECSVEYQGHDRKMGPMPCATAEALSRIAASDVKVFRTNKAVIEFATADGLHRMNVLEKVWQSESLPLKAQIPALYHKGDPNGAVRADSVWGALVAFIGGMLVLALAVRGWVSRGPTRVAPGGAPEGHTAPQATNPQQLAKPRPNRAINSASSGAPRATFGTRS